MNNIYDDEETRFEGMNSPQQPTPKSDTVNQGSFKPAPYTGKPKEKNDITWKRVAASAGAGVLIGSVATMFMSMGKAEAAVSSDNPTGEQDENGLSHPEWVDGDIDVATSVNDDMSFAEAFSAARNEVGAGGVFEWHGQLYGTYTANEWNNMTDAQKAEYGSHFSWNKIDHAGGDVAHHSLAAGTETNDTGNVEVLAAEEHPTDQEIEAELDSWLAHHGEGHTVPEPEPNYLAASVDEGVDLNHNVEILGVSYDSDADVNVGNLTIDGQEVILVDVDGNMEFDYMGVDLNNNGILDQEEMVAIHDEHITVDDLGGFSDGSNEMMAMDEVPDYVMDGSMDNLFMDQSDDFLAMNDDFDCTDGGCYEG